MRIPSLPVRRQISVPVAGSIAATRRTDSGHVINDFYGSVNSWLDRFAPPSCSWCRLSSEYENGRAEFNRVDFGACCGGEEARDASLEETGSGPKSSPLPKRIQHHAGCGFCNAQVREGMNRPEPSHVAGKGRWRVQRPRSPTLAAYPFKDADDARNRFRERAANDSPIARSIQRQCELLSLTMITGIGFGCGRRRRPRSFGRRRTSTVMTNNIEILDCCRRLALSPRRNR